jgi:hypothetical protein
MNDHPMVASGAQTDACRRTKFAPQPHSPLSAAEFEFLTPLQRWWYKIHSGWGRANSTENSQENPSNLIRVMPA